MSDIAINVENLCKAYRLGLNEQKHETMMSVLVALARSPVVNFQKLRKLSRFDELSPRSPKAKFYSGSPPADDVVWAIKDISFQVKQAEVLGIIGRNGAGKSTLLKILSRITEPTSGRATMAGRVGSLLEVGTGFHPDLTGRENVYLNGTILGMRKLEIARKFDEIVDYSGVSRFIDTPVKRYSSGMRVRLAFAVAAHLEPEILVIDEVLAVGDAEFQRKCLAKMEDVASQGRTVLFVSHNMAAVSALCTRAILLEGGSVKFAGATDLAIHAYRAQPETTGDLRFRKDRDGNGALRFTKIEFLDSTERNTAEPATGQFLRVRVGYEADGDSLLKNVDAAILVKGQMGELLFVCIAGVVQGAFHELAKRGALVCEIPRLPLPPGSYQVDLWAQVGAAMADRVEAAAKLDVGSGDYYKSGKLPAQKHHAVLIDYTWKTA